MYFKEKGNTNIDSEFNNNKFDIKKFKVPLIIFGIVIILIIGILALFNINKGSLSDMVVDYYLTLEGEELITIYRGDKYVEPGYIGRDNKGNDLTNEVVVSSNINSSIVGDYEVVYTLNDKILTRYISVVDKPVGATSIYLIGDLTMYLDINSEYVEPGYMAIDSVDSTLTDKVIVKNEIDTSKVGTYYVIYSVTNSSGITIQNKRKVVVTDSEVTLSLDNTNYTNKDINIDVYVSDNYFNYLILPDGNKINNRSYTYTVSSNGEYKFTSYNKNGKESTGSITVSNIDKEKPQGTCSGSYGSGKSSISIKASDNIGISRYVIDGVSYTSSTITLNKDVSKVSITIYDKAGNTNTISCSLSKVENSKPTTPTQSFDYNAPISPKGTENVKYNVSTETIKVWIESVSNYYVSHVWVKDPYGQLKTAVPNNFGNELLKASSILTNAINSHGFQNKVIIAVNGSGFVLKDTYDVSYYAANKSFNKTSVSPIVIVEGKVLRDISNGKIPSDKHVTYGLKKDGYLGYYKYVAGTNDSRNINTSKQIIADGVLNTFAFNPVLVDNGKVVTSDTSPNIRQGFCQIDKNNFVFITNNDGNRSAGFSFKKMAEYMVSLGCITGFNLDGGGSTTLLFKNRDNNIITLTGNTRAIADVIYFHE